MTAGTATGMGALLAQVTREPEVTPVQVTARYASAQGWELERFSTGWVKVHFPDRVAVVVTVRQGRFVAQTQHGASYSGWFEVSGEQEVEDLLVGMSQVGVGHR
jgi:hypothetical protein